MAITTCCGDEEGFCVPDKNQDSGVYLISRGSKVLDRRTKDLLARTTGIRIRSVEEVDAQLKSTLDEGASFFLGQHPVGPLRVASLISTQFRK